MATISIKKTREIENIWRERCRQRGYKPSTQDYYKRQCEFFTGAMSAIAVLKGEQVTVPYWVICIMSGRDILELVDKK